MPVSASSSMPRMRRLTYPGTRRGDTRIASGAERNTSSARKERATDTSHFLPIPCSCKTTRYADLSSSTSSFAETCSSIATSARSRCPARTWLSSSAVRGAIMGGPLTSGLGFHVTHRPVRVPEEVDFTLLAEYVLVNVVMLHRAGRGTGRSRWRGTSGCGTEELPSTGSPCSSTSSMSMYANGSSCGSAFTAGGPLQSPGQGTSGPMPRGRTQANHGYSSRRYLSRSVRAFGSGPRRFAHSRSWTTRLCISGLPWQKVSAGSEAVVMS